MINERHIARKAQYEALVEGEDGCIWMFPKIVGFPPKSSHFNRVFHYKPSILGYPYFWKHPYSLDYITGGGCFFHRKTGVCFFLQIAKICFILAIFYGLYHGTHHHFKQHWIDDFL